jgi:hypothetical protein
VTRLRLAVLLLTLVAAAYPVAAFQTPPGFYEGFCPPVDYRFLNPPPGVKSGNAPAAGHAEIKVLKGIVDPGFVATADDNPQAQLSFVPGAFAAPAGGAGEVIDIKPVRTYPDPTGITVVTNVYQITSSTPMIKTSNLRLLYSTILPAPSLVYQAQPGGSWSAVPSYPSASTGCSDIVSQISGTGLFMAGYDNASAIRRSGGATVAGGQLLPIVVALAILIVVLAGVPLAVLRRRRPSGGEGGTGEPPRGRN